jgi:hypothetical protein
MTERMTTKASEGGRVAGRFETPLGARDRRWLSNKTDKWSGVGLSSRRLLAGGIGAVRSRAVSATFRVRWLESDQG